MSDIFAKTIIVVLITVVVALLVASLIRLLTWLTDKYTTKQVDKEAVVESQSDGILPQHVAAISAALASVLEKRRIVHIERARHGQGWLGEARSQLHSSHNIQKWHHRRT